MHCKKIYINKLHNQQCTANMHWPITLSIPGSGIVSCFIGAVRFISFCPNNHLLLIINLLNRHGWKLNTHNADTASMSPKKHFTGWGSEVNHLRIIRLLNTESKTLTYVSRLSTWKSRFKVTTPRTSRRKCEHESIYLFVLFSHSLFNFCIYRHCQCRYRKNKKSVHIHKYMRVDSECSKSRLHWERHIVSLNVCVRVCVGNTVWEKTKQNTSSHARLPCAFRLSMFKESTPWRGV